MGRIYSMLLVLACMPSLGSAEPLNRGLWYGGGQYTLLTYDEVGLPSVEPGAVMLRGGYFIANQVAVELRIGFGLGTDTLTVPGDEFDVDVGVELDRMYGAYVIGHLPLADIGSIYGLLGVTDARTRFSANGSSVSETDTGLSFGIGAEFYPTDVFSVNVEYMALLDENEYDLSGLSLGVKMFF